MLRAVLISAALLVAFACNRSPSDVVSLEGLGRDCVSRADCVIVNPNRCARCVCSDHAIAKTALPEFEERAKGIKCGKPDTRDCGDCRPFRAVCEAQNCIGKR